MKRKKKRKEEKEEEAVRERREEKREETKRKEGVRPRGQRILGPFRRVLIIRYNLQGRHSKNSNENRLLR